MKLIKLNSEGNSVKVLLTLLKIPVTGKFDKKTEVAVKEFLKSKNLTVDGIVGNNTWAALGVSTRDINEIILHCSATAEGKDFTVKDIKSWHLARGFSDIGYHYVIYRDGSIHKGRDINIAGAHTSGHNANSIGICYIGGCASDAKTPKDTRTSAQKESLKKLVKELMFTYSLDKKHIHGHYEYANKACPSFDVNKFKKELD